MASTPNPRSFQDILKRLVQVFITKANINDLAVGSAIRSILESAAMSDFRTQGDIIAALNSNDIDRAEGVDLVNIGISAGIKEPQANSSSGFVTIGSAFDKIATKVYAGSAAPPAGSTTINVSDASSFPQTGSIYIGRGSNSVEGPLAYTAVTPLGNYFQITLSSPTSKNHNVNESVVLAQGGNRTISAGTVVQTEGNATSPSVSFKTLNTVIVPDGESELTNVQVVATELGTVGNVSANSIKKFASAPFNGAKVTNPTDFINGRDKMSNEDYRLLIKLFNANKTKGTDLAVESAAIGVTSSDDNRTVASAKILKPSVRGEPSLLFIDDNTAYQPIFKGQGFEQVIDNANGGEPFLKLENEDITQALLVTSFTAPFVLTGGMTLAVEVGGVRHEHTFASSDFATQNAADTFEVVNSINANTNLGFSARAINNSKQFTIFAKTFTNDDIKVTTPTSGVNANEFLGFSENLTYTLRLYKNDVLLVKDGIIPTVTTLAQSTWAPMSNGETLSIKVDKSQAITYTINDADFVEFGFPTVNQNNSLSAWASVLNNKIAGITAVVDGNRLKITSNKGANNDASITLYATGTLASKMFGFSIGTLNSQGQTSDFAFNRSTGEIQLTTPASAGDVFTAGSKNTRAFVLSQEINTGSVSLPAQTVSSLGPILWMIVDEDTEVIPNTANASSQITISNPSLNTWRFTSNVPTAFSNVQKGDVVILADDAIHAFDPSFISSFRVTDSAPSYFEVKMNDTLGTTGGPVVLLGSDTITFIRTTGSAQKLVLPDGLQTLTAIANAINSQLEGGTASAVGGKTLRITSNSFSTSGKILVAGKSLASSALGFAVGDSDVSTVTHTAFAESSNGEDTFPEFLTEVITSSQTNIPPTMLNSAMSGNPTSEDKNLYNKLVHFLNPQTQTVSSNKSIIAQIERLDAMTTYLRSESRLREVLNLDRYVILSNYDFDAEDNVVVIFDKDNINKSLNIKLSRKGKVNNSVLPTANQFRAFDTDFAPTANYSNQFGNNFDFNDYKVHFKARAILDPNGPDNKLLIRSDKFGPTGEKIRIGLDYPTSPDSPISSLIKVREKTDIKIYLSSGSEKIVSGTGTTALFDVISLGGNIYQYQWQGVGPSTIDFVADGITSGDIVTIGSGTRFNPRNQGTFRVVAVPNSSSFTVYNPSGVAESAIEFGAGPTLLFYPLGSNTGTEVRDYINTNLSDYVSAQNLQNGNGQITTSTFDDQTQSFIPLVDGENFVLTSNIGTTITPVNQFTLKLPLVLDENDPDYTLVGEDFYLIPVRTEHLVKFLNVFAVTGLSSLANVVASDDGKKLQFFSNLFGSNGAVLVSGGSGNSSEAQVTVGGTQIVQEDIVSIERNGSAVTLTTSAPHSIASGQITVAAVKDSSFNGTFTIGSVTPKTITYTQTYTYPAIASFVRASNIVTVTTASAHTLQVNDQIKINATNPAFSLSTRTPLISVTSNSFTYYQVGPDASSSGGTIFDVRSFSGNILIDKMKLNINKANKAGLQAGQWVKVSNTATQNKDLQMTQASSLAISSLNTLTLNGGTFQTVISHSGTNTTVMRVEKIGKFLMFTQIAGAALNASNIVGNWVTINGNFDAVNKGTYKVVAQNNTAFFVESETGVEEIVTMSGNSDIRFYTYDSMMPGDTIVIETDILGINNKGTYTVQTVTSSTQLTVLPNFFSNIAATQLGASLPQISFKEKSAYFDYKKIDSIVRDPNNINEYTLTFKDARFAKKVSVSAGAGLKAMSKLGFSNTIQTGEDSYKYYGGLISAVGKKIRGQAKDPVGSPGVAASGSFIIPDAPLPKRIQVSIVIRNKTGIPFTTIKSRVQSAVAAYVNSLGVGSPVVFSELISKVQDINGIQAVSISSPTYSSTSDQIVSQFNEKPVMIDNNTDVIVSLAT